jgi:hypothetical protein
MSFTTFTSVLRGLSHSITYNKVIQETKVLILIKKEEEAVKEKRRALT